jgi:UDP:flavonoid glycosyltransferase YjiC (YdhE family)
MRMLFSTTGGVGHFGPLVPVARACAAAGHEVSVAAPASFGARVSASGLTHLPFPDVPADLMGPVFERVAGLSVEEANRLVVTEVFGRLDAQAALPALAEIVDRTRPDIVVRDPCELGAAVAAEHAGVPQVQVAIGVDQFLLTAAGWLDEPVRELESLAGVRDGRGQDLILGTPTLTTVPAVLDHDPAGFPADEPRRLWRFRHPTTVPTGPSLPGRWGDQDTPLLYVSFGSVAGSLPAFAGLYAAVLDVLATEPFRVLMTTGTGVDPATLRPVPANAHVVQWWPQEAAMLEAAVVIGHGGFGTTMAALSAGVPQLVLPLFALDQFLNAQRVEAVGAGAQVLGGLSAVREIPAALHTLLQDTYAADAAGRVAGAMAALPEIAECVEVLEDLAS